MCSTFKYLPTPFVYILQVFLAPITAGDDTFKKESVPQMPL